VHENETIEAKTNADVYLEWFKIRLLSWVFDIPSVPCGHCSFNRSTGFLWPTYSYEASFPILSTIEVFYETINSEIYIHRNHVNTTALSDFISSSDVTGRVEIRAQNGFLWIDIVVIFLKNNFGILLLKKQSIMEDFFHLFEGKPFYQHQGKRVYPSISSLPYIEVRQLNGR
jgi:hypothetical protein